MATEMNAVRRVTQSIAYLVSGLASLLMAIAAVKGVTVLPAGGSRAGPPKNWYVYPIESVTAQILLTGLFAAGGFGLLWMAYKRSKQTDERHSAKRKQKKFKK